MLASAGVWILSRIFRCAGGRRTPSRPFYEMFPTATFFLFLVKFPNWTEEDEPIQTGLQRLCCHHSFSDLSCLSFHLLRWTLAPN
ncbi:hypothetical protein C8J57DRAFT_1267467 [Mycena rebaudengoi]|nr:hypothetical protein C8J57DRAFT_1267467 [Mycena rebaudengoi]